MSPQYNYHELEAGSYVEYYRPNYNRAPSSLCKTSDITDVTLVEVDQRDKFFLSADMPSVYVLEKPQIRDPPPAPNYKPFALRWGFSLILFLMLAAMVALAQYATQALPNASHVSVTIEELPGAGQPDLRARGWQGSPRALIMPKLLVPGKREEPSEGDTIVKIETTGSSPVTSPATSGADPTSSPESLTDSLTATSETPEPTSLPVPEISETTTAAMLSTTKEAITTPAEAAPTPLRLPETTPLTSLTSIETPIGPSSTDQQATTPAAEPTSTTTKAGNGDATESEPAESNTPTNIAVTTSDQPETSNTPETPPIATTVPPKEDPPSTFTIQTSIPEETSQYTGTKEKLGTPTASTTPSTPSDPPKEVSSTIPPKEEPSKTLPKEDPPSTNPTTSQTTIPEESPRTTLTSNTPQAPTKTSEESPSAHPITIQTSIPEETSRPTLTSNTAPTRIVTSKEDPAPTEPFTIQTSVPNDAPKDTWTSKSQGDPITTPTDATTPEAVPLPAHPETSLYTIQTSISEEGSKGTTPLPVPTPTSLAAPESTAPVEDVPTPSGPEPSRTHTESSAVSEENRSPQGYPTPPKQTGGETGPGNPGGPTASTYTETVKDTGRTESPIVAPTKTESEKTHVGTGVVGEPVMAPTQTTTARRPDETGPVEEPIVAPAHSRSEKSPEATDPAGGPIAAPTHTGSEKSPETTDPVGGPVAAPTQTKGGKDSDKTDSNKLTNIGHPSGNPSGRPMHAITSYPTQEATALPLAGGAIRTNSRTTAEFSQILTKPNDLDGPYVADSPPLPMSGSVTGPTDVEASYAGLPPMGAPVRTGTDAALVALETQAKPASQWIETFVIESNTVYPIAQLTSVAKGPDAPAPTTQRPPPATSHRPWTFMVPVPSPTQPTTISPGVAPIVTVILPAETRLLHSTLTSTATWITKDQGGKFVTKVSEKTLDIVMHMVSQEQINLQYPSGLDDHVTAVPFTTLADAHGQPTATLMATRYLKPITKTYTDRGGLPTSTGTAWILGNIQMKPTTVDGRLSTMTYVEKIMTRVMTDKYGRVLGTTTQTATQTPYFRTYYDDGIATRTETLWGPVTETSTLLVKPTAGVDSSAGSAPVELPRLTSADYMLGLIVPTLLAVVLSIPVRIIDQTAKLYQPFHALAGRHGAETIDSLCLRTTGLWGLVGGLKSILRHRVVLPITGTMVLANVVLVPISAEATRLVVQGPDCSVVDPSRCLVSLEAFPALVSVVVAILSLMLVLTLVAAYALWNWTTGVRKPPWNMAEMGRLAANDGFAGLLQGMKAEKGVITNASAVKALGRRRFQLRFWQSGEIWRYGVVVQNDAGSLLPKERKSKNLQKPVAWTSRRKKMPFFALTVGGRLMAFTFILAVLVLVLVYVSTGGPTGFESFMDGQVFGVRFLFTTIGVLISLYWWCFFNAIASLSPYRILLGRSIEEAVRLNPPTNPYSGLWAVCTRRHPDTYLGVVAFTAILADFLPVLSANVPSKVLQASAAHMACTWLTTAVLGIMVIVLTWSLLLTWPHMPMNPSTVAGAMYYALDPFRFLHGVPDDPKLPGGRSSPV